MDAELKAELDRRFEGMVELIRSVAERLETRMEHGFENLGQKIDRLDTRQAAVEMQLFGINRSLDQRDRSVSELIATQYAQQKAIDDLVTRVKRLEEQRPPQ